MTTNQTPIPEPTSPTSVVVGKHKGKAAVAMKMSRHRLYPWFLRGEDGSFISWSDWTDLCALLTDIRVVPVAELEAHPTKVAGCARCDRIEAHALGIEGLLGRRRDQLAKAPEANPHQLPARAGHASAHETRRLK